MIRLETDHPLLRSWEADGAFHLDVRGLLESGEEPYPFIMDCIRQIGAGDRLAVHALFEPKPLIHQARRMGYEVAAEKKEADHWEVLIALPG